MKTKQKPLSTQSEWTFELIQSYEHEISKIAKDFGLSTFPNQIEIISAEQMMDAYSSVGMPVGYHHWSYGKQFLQTFQGYKRGRMGLAYEIVINSNPCISYLMEENSITMQALVIAHACYGHNSFFKNNYLFQTWTSPSAIIDYLVFAKNYVARCEELHGVQAVEQIIDSCHALQNFGVDRYKRPPPISAQQEEERQRAREEQRQQQINLLWKTIPLSEQTKSKEKPVRFPGEPEENILYFVEKNAPLLEPWQREIIRIVRKIAQYFYPQRQTQVMNEGWATFWHYTIINELYDRGLVTDSFMMEFIESHSAVIRQPDFDDPYYSGINPYALGFAIYRDLRRICEEPTEEDKMWFPEYANSDWLTTLDFAMKNFKDESFILQFLSPRVMRDFKFFAIKDHESDPFYVVDSIHNESGYHQIRKILSEQYNLSINEPNIQVINVNLHGNRELTLRHIQTNDRPLAKDTELTLKHLYRLWGFPVRLESKSKTTITRILQVPPETTSIEAYDIPFSG